MCTPPYAPLSLAGPPRGAVVVGKPQGTGTREPLPTLPTHEGDRTPSAHRGFHGYLGRLYGLDGAWMSAFSSGNAGKSLLEEVVETDSTYYDSFLLGGMFHYYGDRMGGFIEFIASILGFSGDRKLVRQSENGLCLLPGPWA